jgi:hypothetical protein
VDDEYWSAPPNMAAGGWGLPIRLTRRFLDDPVPRAVLAADPRFAGSAVLVQPWSGNPFPLTDAQWNAIVDHVGDRGAPDQGGVPAEAAAGAADLLRRLIGVPLSTMNGRINTILAVRPPDVLVATDRSPAGRVALLDAVVDDDAVVVVADLSLVAELDGPAQPAAHDRAGVAVVQADHPAGGVGHHAGQPRAGLGRHDGGDVDGGGQFVDGAAQLPGASAGGGTQGAAGVAQHRLRVGGAGLGQPGEGGGGLADHALGLVAGLRAAQAQLRGDLAGASPGGAGVVRAAGAGAAPAVLTRFTIRAMRRTALASSPASVG